MLTKVKTCANLFVSLIGVVASVLFMGGLPRIPKKLLMPQWILR